MKVKPLTHAVLIEASRNTIINALRVVADKDFAVSEAQRIYSGDQRGMWIRHRKFARETLRAAGQAGLTIAKPYKIQRDGHYAAVVGMLGSVPCPMWHVKLRASA